MLQPIGSPLSPEAKYWKSSKLRVRVPSRRSRKISKVSLIIWEAGNTRRSAGEPLTVTADAERRLHRYHSQQVPGNRGEERSRLSCL